MNLSCALLQRDVLSQPRRKGFYRKRMLFAALGGAVIVIGLLSAAQSRSSTVGLQVFTSLSMATLFAMSFISLSSSSTIVMREKEERTAGLLFLSEISPWNFITGKFLTTMFGASMAILSVLPMFLLAASLGGVSTRQILGAAVVLLSTICFGACIGLFAASVANTENKMNGLITLIYILIYMVLPAGIALYHELTNRSVPEKLMCVVSPFVAMYGMIRGTMFMPSLLGCLFYVALGIPFLCLAAVILPRMVISREKPSLVQRLKEDLRAARKIRKWIVAPQIRGNPVAWKDFHFWHGGARATLFKFFLSVIIVAGIVVLVMVKMEETSKKDIAQVILFSVFGISGAIFGLGSVNHFGMTFNREKKSKAMEMLLTTGLSDGDIILGKAWAAIQSVFPWFVCCAVCAIIIAFIFGHEGDFSETAAAFLLETVSMWFGYCMLAMWVSLRQKKNVAFGACVLVAVLYNWFGRIIIMLIFGGFDSFSGSGVVVADFLFHTCLGLACLALLRKKLRSTALADIG